MKFAGPYVICSCTWTLVVVVLEPLLRAEEFQDSNYVLPFDTVNRNEIIS
jgi:hypothetical protein